MFEILYIDTIRQILQGLIIMYSLLFLLSACGLYKDIKKEKTIEKDGLK